ncbi:MAG TPA: DUF4331 family protein [Acidobacteriaceae bacterium]|jgi:hypothetical protein|nr:DUF4331 family protein [Acidobacteriaceae bacterium]
MSHHYSGPDYGFPHGDARLDLTDLYAFPSPGRGGRTIFVINVHPSVGVNPSGPTTAEAFPPNAIYELKIDTNGDAVAGLAYRVRFSSTTDGSQTAALYRVAGEQAAGTGDGGHLNVEGVPVSAGLEAHGGGADDYRLFAGWRSDPFFFDRQGALNNLQFTGDDFFANGDVCSIVLEVPDSALGSNPIGVWHRTVDGASGQWVQADRGAGPSQSVFLTGDHKAEYLAGEPVDDARFIPIFAHSLEHIGGYAPEEATRVAGSLLPDILGYHPGRPASFPDNGRALTDDALDVFLSIITNGTITTDNVGPHKDLLSAFPFLGPPHEDWSVHRVTAQVYSRSQRRQVTAA